MPNASISKIKFSDETEIPISKNDVVVFVGPNNSGKSLALKNLNDSFAQISNIGLVIKNISIATEGTFEELFANVKENSTQSTQNGQIYYSSMGMQINENDIKSYWQNKDQGLQNLQTYFCRLFSTTERLSLVVRQPAIDPGDSFTHPLHIIFDKDDIAQKVSDRFKDAFGLELIRRLKISKSLLLYVGNDPREENEDRVSEEYLRKLEKLTIIDQQGDGMKAFAGIMIYSCVPHYTVLMVDEPETFLHPPQARFMGRALVTTMAENKQLFISTHSGEILRGILDTDSTNVHVVRIQRDGEINRVKLLPKEELKHIWNAPLLRYSNVLDGVFHERVVICESDADCRFYSAVMDWIYETEGEGKKKPDIMFIHAGGIPSIDKIMRSLLTLSVPTSVVVDFDAIYKQEFRILAENLGIYWEEVKVDRKIVIDTINQIPPISPKIDFLKEEIGKILGNTEGEYILPPDAERIGVLLKKESGWKIAKKTGRASIAHSHPACEAFDRLMNRINQVHFFVVETGELESFCTRSSGHSSKWLKKYSKQSIIKMRRLVHLLLSLKRLLVLNYNFGLRVTLKMIM